MSYNPIPPSSVDPGGIIFPLGVSFDNNTSVIASVYDEIEQVRANITDLLLTYPGERTNEWLTYGCRLREIVFEPNVNELKTEIADMIVDAFNTWLSNVNITNIDITTADDDPNLGNLIEIEISYEIGQIPDSIFLFTNENGVLTAE